MHLAPPYCVYIVAQNHIQNRRKKERERENERKKEKFKMGTKGKTLVSFPRHHALSLLSHSLSI